MGVEMKGCPGSEIAEHYEQRTYDEIMDHNIEDVLITKKLHNCILLSSYYPFK